MQVRDVIAAVDRWAPRELAYDWDKFGLSTGRPDAKVTKILVALTITSDVLKAAVAAKAQMIVSHHRHIRVPLTTLRSDDAQARLCLSIANKKIVICTGDNIVTLRKTHTYSRQITKHLLRKAQAHGLRVKIALFTIGEIETHDVFIVEVIEAD